MDEIQIARAMAELLDNPTARLGGKEVDLDGVKGVTAELALLRARATDRLDYSMVLVETTMTVFEEFAGILDPTYELVLKGARKVVAEEEDEEGQEGGGLCGICLEEMEVGQQYISAMGCMHKFHFFCIYQWLKVKRVCPLCRYSVVIKDQ